ncbi:TerD family protein [Paenibacillus eucommiae]|uniref:Tellurite resistance protein TerA n=1 Tax=Paenibacillus eucommiae TaxID=1355755 RepID=A0ABS4J0X8_9BACL|nr:TerD family protein [Paenibacillus eucommiae]MBP1993492.1 tellurite resistance protein TerA [Paenibacillus eucommiae]
MTVALIKGQKTDLTKTNPGLSQLVIGLGWSAPAQVELDTSAFLLGANGKVANDDNLIFYNNPNKGFINYMDKPAASTDKKQFAVQLSAVPANIEKIAVTLTIYDGEKLKQQFSQVTDAYLRIVHSGTGQEIVRYDLGNQFSVETAIVVGELYRYNGEWKFSAIGSGFSGGLKALCGNFGIEVKDEPASEPVPQPPKIEPAPVPQPPTPIVIPPRPATTSSAPPAAPVVPASPQPSAKPVSLSKIELKKKGEKINLEKKAGGSLGEILINLNWNQKSKPSGFFSRNKGIDLDLACLYELKNGEKGVVQALGDKFGSLNRAPYISLDGDDRTGSVKTGENIRINGNKLSEIERVLIFTFIYEGATNWAEADGVVSIKHEGGPDIEVRLNEHDNRKGLCAIALIKNSNNETFSIERLVQFFSGHPDLDKAFNWGLRWVAGSK